MDIQTQIRMLLVAGYTTREIAFTLGVSQSTIVRILGGKTKPKLTTMAKIEEELAKLNLQKEKEKERIISRDTVLLLIATVLFALTIVMYSWIKSNL